MTTSRDLTIVKDLDMRVLFPYYRVNPAPAGDPMVAITLGRGQIELYPKPNYSVDAGIVFRGFGTPTNDMWPDNTDECPIAELGHEAIKWRVASRLARRNKDLTMAQSFHMDWLREKALYQSEMNRLTEAHRHRFPVEYYPYSNAGDPLGLNPLNL